MSTTVTLNTAVLCEYKTGTLGPYTVQEGNARVTGKIYWTYKDKKISFYFKASARQTYAAYSSSYSNNIWYGNQAGYMQLTVNGSSTGWRFCVRQTTYGSIASGTGWIENAGTYDQTTTITIAATTSAVSLVIGFKTSSGATKTVSFTTSKNTMVSTVPKVEYYRSGANVLARVICVTTRSSTTYSDSYTYTAKITVNGSSQTVTLSIPSTATSSTNTSSWVTVASTANSLTATVYISSTNGGTYSSTQTATLSVPAMSSIAGNPSGALGSDYAISITRYDSSFTDSLSYYINGTLIDTIVTGLTGDTSSFEWSAPPVSLASYSPNAVSVVVTIRCTTSSGATTIGTTDLSVTFAIPETVVPTLGSVSLTKVNSNPTVSDWSIYLQSYSQCKIEVTGSTGVYGSSISSFTVKVGSLSVSGTASSSNANWTGTSNTLSTAGTIPVSVTCTDSRGRSVTSSQTITVYEYASPTISSGVCYRSDSGNNSTELEDGTYIYAYAKLIYSSAGNNNSASMTVKYRSGTSGNYTTGGTLQSDVGTKFGGGNISVASPWEVVIEATDSLGNTNSYTYQLSTGTAAIHIRPGGTGICFGGYSQNDDSVEIADGMAFLMGNSVIRSTLPVSGIAGQLVMLLTAGTLVPYVYTGSSWVCTLLSAYPIGAVYMSTVSTSPEVLFGGTWEQLKDIFLLAAGDTYAAGSTGGAATVTLTTANLPAHTHGSKSLSGRARFRTVNSGSRLFAGLDGIMSETYPQSAASYETVQQYSSTKQSSQQLTINATHEHNSVGSGTAHNNMPPFLAVFVWKRTA